MSVSPDWRPYFFCLSKRNRGKKKTPHTMGFAFPALLDTKGSNRKLATLKQPIAENPLYVCVARRGARGYSMIGEMSQ